MGRLTLLRRCLTGGSAGAIATRAVIRRQRDPIRSARSQSFFGLLRDEYAAKPAFATYRRLIARFGARR